MPRRKATPKQPPPLAAYLQAELVARNMTLLQIEEITKIPDATLSRIFSGKVADPKGSQLAKIGLAMGIPYHKIMAHVLETEDTPIDPEAETLRIASLIADEPNLQIIMGKLAELGPRDLRAVRKYIESLRGDD